MRILDAMARACAELGASNVTVSCVVERSGVSRRTFYELFGDRDECLLATIDDALARVSVPVLAAYRSAEDWQTRIQRALVACLGFLEEEPFVARLLVVEMLGCGGPALERRQRVLESVVAAVEEGRSQAKAGDPPPLTAEGVGGVLAVLHARLLDSQAGSLVDLTGHLMSILTLPYLGQAAARRELSRPLPRALARPVSTHSGLRGALRGAEMRFTYRTVRVLASVASHPGASNRELALVAGVQDQGQISKILTRLARVELIENRGSGRAHGGPNSWVLTAKGAEVHRAVGGRATVPLAP